MKDKDKEEIILLITKEEAETIFKCINVLLRMQKDNCWDYDPDKDCHYLTDNYYKYENVIDFLLDVKDMWNYEKDARRHHF